MEGNVRQETDELEDVKAKIISLVKNDANICDKVSKHLKKIKLALKMDQSQKFNDSSIKEQEKIDRLRGDFNFEKSDAWNIFMQRGWSSYKKEELLLIAFTISEYIHTYSN